VAFRDATVMGPSTRTSLPYILTGLEGPDAHGRVFRAPTVLEYAKARGYHTAFISAQEESWGNFDVLFREGADTFRSGIAFAANVDVMGGADGIDVLEQGVLPALQTIAEPFFVVLHMNGGHAPYAYHSRTGSKVFLPEDRVNSINAYDNTVRETDEYLARLFDALRARDPSAWMFYTSDHGQPLGEGNAFFNHGYQENVIRDPLLAFAPAPERAQLAAAAAAQVAACDLAPTLLHVMGVPAAWPMDCVDLLAEPAPMRSRVRVVSAYTPAYVDEPTMLLVLEDGKRELFDLARGTVDFQESETLRVSEVSMPPKIVERLR
jgi:phosphoglycerol transferase MdoB-like AlkP superfamily enzyme